MLFIELAKRGRKFELRKVPGVAALEEGVNRAIEMGRPVHWTEGHPLGSKLYDSNGPYLVAGLAILNYVTTLCARLKARLIVNIGHTELFPLVHELVRYIYLAEGASDRYVDEDIQLMPEQSYAIALVGRMERNSIGCHVQTGYFWSQDEVLIPEVAQGLGAYVVTGAQVDAIPYVIMYSSSVFIADEFFAAAADITKYPIDIGALKGCDWVKVAAMLLLVAGSILATLGNRILLNLVNI
jgi:hypothetical protein